MSAVARPDQEQAARHHVSGVFFLVSVTSEWLTKLAEMLDAGHLTPRVGDVLPLAEVRLAHEMLVGKPHKPGKIALAVSA